MDTISWSIFEEDWPTGHAPYCHEPYHSLIYYCSSDGSGNYLSEIFRRTHTEEVCRRYSERREGSLMTMEMVTHGD